MFDDVLAELKSYERGKQVTISLPTGDDGYFDRQCPSSECRAEFKILEEDWGKLKVGETLCCPLCKHTQDFNDFATEAQVEYAKQKAFAEFSKLLGNALERGARRFNARPQSGFITMKLSVKQDGSPIRLPKAVGEAMEQRFSCEECSARYASIGAAYFCPKCGHNSVLLTFNQTLEHVNRTILALSDISKAFGPDRDGAMNAVNLILEQSLSRLVGAFERFTEALFTRKTVAAPVKLKKGIFQRIPEASNLWREKFGRSYEDILGQGAVKDVIRAFQRRHLLAHREGVVDSEYVTKSGDTTLAIGQRIRIREEEVISFASHLRRLAAELI